MYTRETSDLVRAVRLTYMEYTKAHPDTSFVWVAVCVSITWKLIDKSARENKEGSPHMLLRPSFRCKRAPPFVAEGTTIRLSCLLADDVYECIKDLETLHISLPLLYV